MRYLVGEAIKEGKFPSFAWPGGYPLFYITRDNGALCPECCNKEFELIREALANRDDPQWEVIVADINFEDNMLYCDHCSQRINSAYGDE